MSYPSMDQYQEAVQDPQRAFVDPALQQGKVLANGMGLPLALGGGFALTYTVNAGSRKFAVRCFHKQAAGLQNRYAKIGAALANVGGTNFVGFEYQQSGIRVLGNLYPIVRMDWVNGDTLGVWLDDHHGEKAAVTQLVTWFRDLERFLRARGIAHGDLQNGNVLVVGNSIKLIDYDGLFVPGLAQGQGNEVGHKHFQHPKRQGADFGPAMDRFSFIVIDLSLRALAEKPALFLRHSNGDNILFSAGDYLYPASSQVFADVRAIPSLTRDTDNFAKICQAPIDLVPALDDFLANRNIPATVIAFPSASQRPSPGQTLYVGAYDVIDARDFVAGLRRVGDRVELVGLIVEVKDGKTKKSNKPYVFINFGPWQGSIIKLSIWPDALRKLRAKPDKSWEGKWISVTGLLEPPYQNPKYRYSHIAISIEHENQYRIIDAAEAQRRLASSGQASVSSNGSAGNQSILNKISGAARPAAQSASKPSPGSPSARSTKSPNRILLEQLNKQQPVALRPQGAASTGLRRSAAAHTSSNRSVPQPAPSNGASGNRHSTGKVPTWVWWVGALILLWLFSRLGHRL